MIDKTLKYAKYVLFAMLLIFAVVSGFIANNANISVAYLCVILPLGIVFLDYNLISGKMRLITVTSFVFSGLFIWYFKMHTQENLAIDKFAKCLISTLTTFTNNANYEYFIGEVSNHIGYGHADGMKTGFLFFGARCCLSLLFVAAPVTTAAVVLEVLSNLFVRFKLWLYKIVFFWRPFVYFSELNECSVALARSLCDEGRKYVIVFADVYTDDEQEKSSELLVKAKSLGGICTKQDMRHIKMRMYLPKKIFLINQNEENNINVLTVLCEGKNKKMLDGAEMYVFSGEDNYMLVCTNIREKLSNLLNDNQKQIKQKHISAKKSIINFKNYDGWLVGAPWILTVNGYQNLVYNLLKEMPLYEPLVQKSDNCDISVNSSPKTLNLTIFGAGEIGTQMFLAAYWFGQILGYRLYINVISKESEEDFIKKIEYINPEIFNTIMRVGQKRDEYDSADALFSENTDIPYHKTTKEYNSIMKMYPASEKSNQNGNPYFVFRYYKLDVENGELGTKLTQNLWDDDFCLCESDYIVVSLGSDSANLSVANKIKKHTAIYKFNTFKDEKQNINNTVISYVVYNSDLCRNLNSHTDTQLIQNSRIYMHAFGSFDDVYNVKNIFMKSARAKADEMYSTYESIVHDTAVREYNPNKTPYDFWANVSRALHLPYKLFSAGYIKNSVFTLEKDLPECNGFCNYIAIRDENNKDSIQQYCNGIVPCEGDSSEVIQSKKQADIYRRLTWLEHRRWNAFMRASGFVYPKDFMQYYPYTKSHKEMKLKLHPCLVESSDEPVNYNLFESVQNNNNDCNLDGIDLFSVVFSRVKQSGINDFANYKDYDTPVNAFDITDDGIKKADKTEKQVKRISASLLRTLGNVLCRLYFKVYCPKTTSDNS